MFKYKSYRIGNLVGTQYFFPKRGDGLPMHPHNEEDKHNVILLSGSVMIYGPNKSWCYTMQSGDIFHFDDNLHYPHEIVALEDETMILNLCIWGDKYDFLKGYGLPGEGGEMLCNVTIPLDTALEELQIKEEKKSRKKQND